MRFFSYSLISSSLFLLVVGFQTKMISGRKLIDITKFPKSSSLSQDNANLKTSMKSKFIDFNTNSQLFAVIGAKTVETKNLTFLDFIKNINWTEVVAKFAGYVVGLGAMTIYTPIVYGMLRQNSADGYALSTWIFNLIGLTAGF